ncbi:hypothetical protein [Streptomyces sp. ISL-94]|uniref:divisome protein SepX/GlpR n=1 Tax=Streptomyces sp. ISL-94 TaxID=2819190 RepID=UPI001BE64E2D|nr:hypothetical protein [Streptomyces sp. ISL-94]MBT2479455.1 hypothetical protein [Streptomyces sp. ISL-94]
MSSSGLIYAVIVGAWAAYLVPMWLRRQDELNEARPTERFSTAIRLLSGRAGMERRYAKGLRERGGEEAEPQPHADPDAATETVNSVDADARAFVVPPTRAEHRAAAAERVRREQRLQVLARRRRTTLLLFLLFTLGAVVAAVGGLGFLWAPAVPALLLSTYIVHLRVQERRRYEFTMDRRRAEAAARHLRENRAPRRRESEAAAGSEPDPAPPVSPQEAGRRALVEQTDHAEWVDQQRERDRGPARGDSWEPVPVPLPTYVTAPVAPRATGPATPDAWSATRSSTAEPTEPRLRAQPAPPKPDPKTPSTPRPRGRDRGRTPLFDQYESDDRPRAANE